MTEPARRLRILHVLRSPVGGLFRHVADLVRSQSARGHAVGLICDSLTGGDNATEVLRQLSPHLSLGLTRIAMGRHIGFGDFSAIRHVALRVRQAAPDIVHGHGAKGAAYARLAVSSHGPLRVCTPHGGSLLFQRTSAGGRFYLGLEKLLNRRTDLFVFESAFIERLFRDKVGEPAALSRIVPNGVGPDEFASVALAADATDFLYIGELRSLKGVDLLLDALASLRARGLPHTATIVGAGSARDDLERQARESGLGASARFVAPMPARKAFALGRIMVVPSRAESFPYIVLEAAAAGKPLVATRVGGIPDMFGPLADRLVVPDDCIALERALEQAVNHSESMSDVTRLLQARVRANFSLDDMVDGGIDAYCAAIAARKS